MYGPKVLEHFQNPRFTGKIPDADGVGYIAEGCGDVFRFYIKVKDYHLEQVRYEIKGCPAAIASCSMTATLAEGKSIFDALEITNEVVEKALGGLPPEKRHCSNMAADALYEAIQDYLYDQVLNEKVDLPGSAREHPQSVCLEQGEDCCKRRLS